MSDPKSVIDDYVEQRSKVFWQDALSHLNAEEASSLDYRGRFLFELLQNAVDRADGEIHVHLDRTNRRLYFGNDGAAFTIYEREDGKPLSDFHALCSIHTSSKLAAESIGNKGVGFKSVWEVASRATIHSRTLSEDWWGFRLHKPLEPALCESARPRSDGLIQMASRPELNLQLPSFYFPEWLSDAGNLPPDLRGMKTVVVLEWSSEAAGDRVEEQLETFCKTHLYFLALKHRGRVFRVRVTSTDGRDQILTTDPTADGWVVFHAASVLPTWKSTHTELLTLAREVGFELEEVTLSIALPPNDGASERRDQVFYSYLPTEVRCGFSAIIHADFLLDNSRKAIDFKKPFNLRLAELAADLLLAGAQREQVARRSDVFRFLTPGVAVDAFADSVEARLLPDGSGGALLGTMAKVIFDAVKGRPECFYDGFFDACTDWRNRLTRSSSRADKRRRDAERRLWSVIRETRVPCVPVTVEATPAGDLVTHAVRLPEVEGDRKAHRGNTVFYRPREGSDDDVGEMQTLPVFAHEQLRETLAITTWSSLPDYWDTELRLTRFRREEIIQHLGRAIAEAENAGRHETLPHEGLLRFLWELLADQRNTGSDTSFARGSSAVDRLRQLDRDGDTIGALLSRFRVPVEGGGWVPAHRAYDRTEKGLADLLAGVSTYRALDEAEIKRVCQAPAPSDTFGIDRFARLLGVWNCIPVVAKDESWALAVDLQSLDAEAARVAASILSRHWARYQALQQTDSELFARFKERLQTDRWFPLDSRRNTEHALRAAPREVWLVDSRDVGRLRYHHKYAPEDLPLESGFLRDLEIVAEPEASAPKLIAQVRKMHSDWAEDDSIRSGVELEQRFKPRYRSAMRLLSKKADELPLDLPVLCEGANGTHWRPDGDRREPVYFYGERTRRLRSSFKRLTYAVLDPETGVDLVSRLGLERFKCTSEIVGDTRPDPETREALGPALPYLLAIADCVRVGGAPPEEAVLLMERWLKIDVERGDDVFVILKVIGRKDSESLGKGTRRDVFLASGKDDDRVRIVHDLEQPTQTLERFAAPLADGVFRNPLFAEYFARVLGLLHGEPADLDDYLESRGVERAVVDEKKRLVAEKFLSPGELQGLVDALRGVVRQLTGREPQGLDDPLHLRVENFDLDRDSLLTFDQVNRALPQRLSELGVRLESAAKHHDTFAKRRAALRTKTLAACLLAQPAKQRATELDQLRRDYDQLDPGRSEFERLAFDPDVHLVSFLAAHDVPVSGLLDIWAEQLPQQAGYAEAILFLESGFAFSMGEPAVLQGELKRGASKSTPGNHVVAAKDIDGRQSDTRKTHAQGVSAERYFALIEAQRLQVSGESAWPVVKQELCRVSELAGGQSIDTSRPTDLNAWADRLHVAKYFDGVGYDVLTVDGENRLVRVEVKSASGGRAVMHFSEPECAAATRYLDPAGDGANAAWRVALFVQQDGVFKQYDATERVREALRGFQRPAGPLYPSSYTMAIEEL